MTSKILYILFTFFVSATISLNLPNQNSVLSLLDDRSRSLNDETCVSAGSTCYDDNTMKFCLQNGNQFILTQIPCKSINPDTPYCDKQTNKCVPYIQNYHVECYDEGFLSDPLNCQHFILCLKVNGMFIKLKYKCEHRSVYNHLLKSCIKHEQCLDFRPNNLCYKKEGKYAIYPFDNSIYSRCPKKNELLLINKCPNNFYFNTQTNQCEVLCNNLSKLKNPNDDNSFYECTLVGARYVSVLRQCPERTKFDQRKQICHQCDCNENVDNRDDIKFDGYSKEMHSSEEINSFEEDSSDEEDEQNGKNKRCLEFCRQVSREEKSSTEEIISDEQSFSQEDEISVEDSRNESTDSEQKENTSEIESSEENQRRVRRSYGMIGQGRRCHGYKLCEQTGNNLNNDDNSIASDEDDNSSNEENKSISKEISDSNSNSSEQSEEDKNHNEGKRNGDHKNKNKKEIKCQESDSCKKNISSDEISSEEKFSSEERTNEDNIPNPLFFWNLFH